MDVECSAGCIYVCVLFVLGDCLAAICGLAAVCPVWSGTCGWCNRLGRLDGVLSVLGRLHAILSTIYGWA